MAWDLDYIGIFQDRMAKLARIEAAAKEDPAVISALFLYYRNHIPDFIDDWGITYDPRNAGTKLPTILPFVMFPKQREWVEWFLDHMWNGRPGLTEKSRDCGASWLAMATSCSLCLFQPNILIGFGSNKVDQVDKTDNPKALFPKGRQFLNALPKIFRRGWDERKHSRSMIIKFPATNATISGDGGKNIGRGGRTKVYVIDESAHLEHPEQADFALANNTDCRIDISSVNGMANPFAQKRHSGKIDVFTFHWRDDPRKDDEWYRNYCETHNPVVVAQEVDINYSASAEGILLPSDWIQAAVDAHIKLKIEGTGRLRGALDVADEGLDKNAFVYRHGVILRQSQDWSGTGADIFATTQHAFRLCDHWGLDGFDFDGDGMGAGVRGDARVINDGRKRKLVVNPWRGSAGVMYPTRKAPGTEINNEDFFANAKAQGWWHLRWLFENTFYAVIEGRDFDPDEIISLDSANDHLSRLTMELMQPTYSFNTAGKMLVDKAPDGTKSPNLGDACMIAYALKKATLRITREHLESAAER